jgi:hypothetical protein
MWCMTEDLKDKHKLYAYVYMHTSFVDLYATEDGYERKSVLMIARISLPNVSSG